jgi:rod shape-determining protein MreD
MTFSRVVLSTLLILTAAVLQMTVVNRLPLPGTAGASFGFAAGLLVDLMPPTATEVGRWALVLCLVGYLAGQVTIDARRSVLRVLAVVAGLSAVSVVLYAGVGLLFGDSRVTADLFVSILLSTVLYDLLLAPFVIPGVMALARRTAVNPAVV